MRLLGVDWDEEEGTITVTLAGDEEDAEALDDMAGNRVAVSSDE